MLVGSQLPTILEDQEHSVTTTAGARVEDRLLREVLDAQRRRVIELRDEGAISGDVLHALERELDLEDQRLEI